MEQQRGLSDPEAARFAWRRFRRIFFHMNMASLTIACAGVAAIWLHNGGLPWIFAGLSFVGIYLTLLMAAALMGLMFLSNGTGHDEDVMDFAEGGYPLDD